MISIENLSIQYGGRILFDQLSFVVKTKDRIGLVGKNGAGKSTMLKIIMDLQHPDEGNIAMPNGTTFGYLPQDIEVTSTKSVIDETSQAFSEINKLKERFEKLTTEMKTRTDYESESYAQLLHNFSSVQERLQYLGAGNMRAEAEKILKGLGFENGQFDRPLSTFSGGWQMRVELAKILLAQPDYILLDEPTNHLDIESIIWLENFLKRYHGGILLISHDQRFLDTVSNRTIELVNGKLYDYPVPYSDFLELREKRREKQISEKKKQEKFVEHTETLINKFRAKKNKAKFAQTLMKKLDRVEEINIDDVETAKISFRFPAAPRSGKIVVKTNELHKHYDTLHVLNGINLEVERGEKIAFVGKNGEGKTTLSKIIAGKTNLTGGECELGHNVSIGYYEQHQAETLDPKKTVFETIDDVAAGEMRLKVRNLLGSFLFSGEDADKKVSVLSGGEKSRLAIAKLLLNPVNLLILDEPTNHLDIRSKEILQQAVINFEGTVIIVSHDREFLKGLTDKVYEFRNRKIKSYFGDIDAFLEKRKLDSLDDLDLKKEVGDIASLRKTYSEQEVAEKDNLPNTTTKRTSQEQREYDKAVKKLKNKVNSIEKEIEVLESRKSEIETMMNDADFYTSNPDTEKIMGEYAKLKNTISETEEQWETLAMELEEMEES